MKDSFKVASDAKGQIFVLLHERCKIGRQEILSLLEKAGFEPSQIIFLDASDNPDFNGLGSAPLIIPVDDESGDLPELDHAGLCSGRVVVLLGPTCSIEGLHPLAKNYGTQCGWSVDQLKDCVSNEGKPPRAASGSDAVWDDPKQVNCKKSK